MVDLLSFWTGCSTVRQEQDSLCVTFDGGVNVLPLPETCFKKIILPEKHTVYEDLKKKHGHSFTLWFQWFYFHLRYCTNSSVDPC